MLHVANLVYSATVRLYCRKQLLQIASRSAYFWYWVFDNLLILSKVKIFRFDTKKLARICGYFWLVGLAASLAIEVSKYWNRRRKYTRDSGLLSQAEETTGKDVPVNVNGTPTKVVTNGLRHIRDEQRQNAFNIVKIVSDMLVAANLATIPQKLSGRSLGDGIVGTAGFVSGAISCYQLYD